MELAHFGLEVIKVPLAVEMISFNKWAKVLNPRLKVLGFIGKKGAKKC